MNKLNEPMIILLTFNRPRHTAEVLRGLKKEGATHVTVYMDAPVTEEDRLAQVELTELFDAVDWMQVDLIRREKNLGLAVNMVSSINEQLQTHESVIILEDDCYPYPGFLRFMREALSIYKGNKKIRSVCGYQYPFIADESDEIVAMSMSRFNPWGWATWRDRWDDHCADLKMLLDAVCSKGVFERLSWDLQQQCSCEYFVEQKADIWSINWALAHYLTETYAIFPSRSLIKNIGFDGTGVHSCETKVFDGKLLQDELAEFSLALENDPPFNTRADKLVEEFLSKHISKVMYKQGDAIPVPLV